MTVTEGQVVARLDSVLAERDYELARSRVETADAAVAAITADLEDASRIMSRVQTLSQKNFATEADLTKAQARVGVLSAQLRQAQSQFETARIDAKRSASMLDKHQIRAPFAGVVVDRSAQPGEMISPMSVGGYTRTGICTIVDMDSIEIEVDVNEAFIGRVVAGGAVNAMLDAYPDWTIPASVIAIVPTANREKATVKVRIRFEKKDPRILPDMAVKVNFLGDAKAKGTAETTAAN
jgi:RND family efflux transporter MFP subunit